jgi:hypothetical protein
MAAVTARLLCSALRNDSQWQFVTVQIDTVTRGYRLVYFVWRTICEIHKAVSDDGSISRGWLGVKFFAADETHLPNPPPRALPAAISSPVVQTQPQFRHREYDDYGAIGEYEGDSFRLFTRRAIAPGGTAIKC